MRRRTFLALGLGLFVSSAATLQAQTTTVILVRHSERADSPDKPDKDPPLSPAGIKRAERLSDYLRNAGVGAIYSTPYVRTRETAQPLAKALGITITETPIEAGQSAAVFAKGLADRILSENKGKTVLVVGHSNTIPATVAALGAPPVPAIGEADYGDTYIVQVSAAGKATVIRAKH